MVFHFQVISGFLNSIFRTCANLREKNAIVSYTLLFLNNFFILKIFSKRGFILAIGNTLFYTRVGELIPQRQLNEPYKDLAVIFTDRTTYKLSHLIGVNVTREN